VQGTVIAMITIGAKNLLKWAISISTYNNPSPIEYCTIDEWILHCFRQTKLFSKDESCVQIIGNEIPDAQDTVYAAG
jgi:hypothetical protein